MIKIFLYTVLMFFINSTLLSDETNCKKFDLKCKTKKFIDDTKSFQSKGLDESKEQINKFKDKVIKGKNEVLKKIPKKQ